MSEPLPNRAPDSEFEPGRLLDIFNNDRRAVGELLAEASTSMRDTIDRVAEEAALGDKQAVAGLLHTLTGVAANIGANRFSSLSADLLEQIHQRQTLPSNLVERLRLGHDRFMATVQEFLGTAS